MGADALFSLAGDHQQVGQSRKELRREARYLDEQAEDLLTEAGYQAQDVRDAAFLQNIEGQRFLSNQLLSFMGSGVSMEGSPLAVLSTTRQGIEQDFMQMINRAGRIEETAETSAGRLRGRAGDMRKDARGQKSIVEQAFGWTAVGQVYGQLEDFFGG